MKYQQQIEAYVAENEQLLLDSICRLVRIRSVKGDAAPGMPFGPGPAAALDEALKLGNSRVFNIIVLGVAAKHMDFSKEAWLQVIEKTVPPKTVEINKKAFLLGFES